jgi:hypothetical protein
VEIELNHIDTGPRALYRWDNGTLTPLVVPGQSLTGGGQFTSLQNYGDEWESTSVSFANDRGQHAFFARVLEGNESRWAAYLLDSDGTVTPILKTGDSTAVGTIIHVGDQGAVQRGLGIGLNNKGQVAVSATVPNTPPMILLLTPAAQ